MRLSDPGYDPREREGDVMASQAYHHWVADGRPWKFARPITQVGDRLRAHGYTVYYQGNQSHLEHEPPEDHTPFSATGWPGKSPYPYCMAMDIMPPKPGQKSKITGAPLPSLAKLAAQLRGDKIDEVKQASFVKYINWEPQGGGGPCYHDSWTPSYSRRTSSDRGHIHVSARSDSATSTLSDGYDLVARILGTPAMEEDTMSAADAKQGIADAFAAAATVTNDTTTDDDAWGRQFIANFNRVVDQSEAAGPLKDTLAAQATAIQNLTALVVQQTSASAQDIAAALAPLLGDVGGASPDEVEQRLRKVLGSLNDA
jgi:hypothetical protein